MTLASILRLLDFSKPYEITYDTSRIEIGGIPSQENPYVAFFSEKLNEPK